jgi:predicted DNA-binding transcriptional regulator AlpA
MSISQLPLPNIPALLSTLAAVQVALASRLLGWEDIQSIPSLTRCRVCGAELAADVGDTSAVTNFSDNGDGDRLLDARRAAQMLGVSTSFLYRRKKLPFVVRVEGGAVRFSAKGIERYICAGRAKE